MRVKRLEIQGFKSFKDKTIIHFDHGITGIVGPNGCGKSNIVDAFFWVMGEQSYKHMRGNSSEDLIFNGSSKYSPMGIAEATLVMETEYVEEGGDAVLSGPDAPAGASSREFGKDVKVKTKEVSVTRKLYRSGEGEYFINGTLARLKDIQELFMDTGVGAKGYSVIEQGQIGKIVNSKPEERRLLIEEAAGIAKYKARKKESLRKLEAAELNLGRLSDVIAEIERSVNSLDRQAQKARQYKKYKEELLDKEMTWGRRKAQVLRQKLTELQKDKTALEQELVGLRVELHTAETSIETDRLEQVVDNQASDELQAQISQISSELATERSALDLSRRRQGDLAEQLESLENEKIHVQQAIEEETAKLEERKTLAQEAEDEHRSSASKAQSMDETVRRFRQETETARRALDQSKRELMNGITEASHLTSKSASLESRAQGLEAQLERLRAQAETLEAKSVSAQEEAVRIRTASEELQAQLSESMSSRQEVQGQVGQLQSELRSAEQNRDLTSKSLTQVRSKLESLEELASAYEGFSEGPRAALDWAKSQGLGEKLIALADAFQVDSQYEGAFAGFLDARVESLIAQDADTALGALQEIITGKQGRLEIQGVQAAHESAGANFSSISQTLKSSGFEVIGELSQLIQVDSRLEARTQAIATRLIARVAVVQSLDPLKTSTAELSGWNLVTLDGSVFDSNSGTLRGGAANTDQSAALLRRKRMISELQDQVTQAQSVADEATLAYGNARSALETAQARLSTLQSDIQSLQVQKAALDRDLHQSARAVEEARGQIEFNAEETLEIQSTLESGRAEREEIEAEVSEIIAARTELEGRISQDDTDLAAKDSEVRAQEAELQSLRVNEASLRERSSSLKRELDSGRLLIQDREKRSADITRTLEKAAQERSQYNGGESQLENNIQDLTQRLSTAREELSTVKDRLEQSSAKLNGALEKIKELHKVGDRKTTETNQFALEVEKISSDLSHLIQNLEEKYGPGCLERPVTSPIQEEMSEPVITAEMSAEEEQLLGEDVERLRERIRRLGEVNVGAIEEYEETKKRFDHLAAEKSDLESSIQNLKDAIDHINKTSEERFRKAFDAIADRFERLFPIIFGGGQAKLSLVYPEGSQEILDAGVDILAQPPGKKVVNIGLLSGGEKALTAVSLIFAIFMVKPSPFCVLDEVDAPLDDANIGKFNALLREMSAKSQFILITHNKKTMELNDTLYGVTMEEPGVSKMVSIEMH